jgi:dihydroorotate dehydrogenase
MYAWLRRFLFVFPPEKVHYFSMGVFSFLCALPFLKGLLRKIFQYHHPSLKRTLFGLDFINPVGLGAGFDKNARWLREMEVMGFGFVEIGTVTPKPQEGNPKPRLFRLPKDRALINRMGFNNDGVDAIEKRLENWRMKNTSPAGKPRMLIGGNIGKNKSTPNEEAWKDYETCFVLLHPYVDFFVVNVSSPNTPGLRELQDKDALKNILTRLQEENKRLDKQKPILLKIAPDLTDEQVNDVIDLVKEIELSGLVATNTTISREGLKTGEQSVETIGAGGLSGAPLQKKSTEFISRIHSRSNGAISIIGSGGIFNAGDARQKMDAGASLVEVWTGFIYEGPAIVKNILKGLP